MNESSEIPTEMTKDVADLFKLIPSSMRNHKKGRRFAFEQDLTTTKFDNPKEAEEAFAKSRDNVERKSFEAPKTHKSEVSDKPFVRPPTHNTTAIKATAKYHQQFFAKANAQLKRKADKEKKTLVYDRSTSKLSFSGNVEDAVKFILSKMESGEWNETSFALYLPKGMVNGN